MAFVSPGEEVIVFEPFFDQSVIPRKRSYLDTLILLLGTSVTSNWLAESSNTSL